LPDISKINALAIGSVSKVDGLAKASILDIDGVTVPSGVAPAAAYSVRLLGSGVGISSYTGDCMRVRRASDNVEADIAFDAGELKLTSGVSNTSDALSYTDFADFVDHTGTPTDAFVRWWYDQSGNANDAGQSTAGNQPQIYDATTGLIEDGSAGNEKPALSFDSDGFDPITGSKSDVLFHTSSQGMLYNVGNYTASQNQLRIICETNGTSSSKTGFVFAFDDRSSTGNNDYGYYSLSKSVGASGAIIATQEASFVGAQYLMAIHYDFESGIFQYQNGSLLDSALDISQSYGTGDATNDLAIGNIAGNYTYSLVGKMQELILYNADDTNRNTIETNVNGFFSIY